MPYLFTHACRPIHLWWITGAEPLQWVLQHLTCDQCLQWPESVKASAMSALDKCLLHVWCCTAILPIFFLPKPNESYCKMSEDQSYINVPSNVKFYTHESCRNSLCCCSSYTYSSSPIIHLCVLFLFLPPILIRHPPRHHTVPIGSTFSHTSHYGSKKKKPTHLQYARKRGFVFLLSKDVCNAGCLATWFWTKLPRSDKLSCQFSLALLRRICSNTKRNMGN